MSGNYGRLKPSTKRHNANISMAYGCSKDPNTYCYRMTNGHKHLHRIILGRGWENIPFDATKLSCYEGKGEESMKGRKAKEKPSNAELMAFAKKHNFTNLTGRAKTEYHVGYDTAKKWLTEAGLLAKQTSEPGGAQPDPAQSKASAKAIITDEEIKETLDKCEVCGEESYPEGPQLNKFITADGKEVCYTCYFESEYSYLESEYSDKPSYTPTDNDYNEEPQRTTLTKAQYDAMAMNDDRLSALAIFCENQAVEQLRQDWAVSVFKHSRLSRERKLELIGQLLDWGAGA